MNFRPFVLALTVLCALPSLALADEEATSLESRGKALKYTLKTKSPDNSIDTGGAAIFVHAPIAAVRKIVTDYRHYDTIIKPFDQSKLLSRSKGTSEVYLQVPILHGAAKVWAVLLIGPPEKDGDGEKIVARFQRGNVDDFRAVWRLRAVDEQRTILKLELLVDPQMPAPSSVITQELTKASEKAVTAVRNRVEQPNPAATAQAPIPEEPSGENKGQNVAKN